MEDQSVDSSALLKRARKVITGRRGCYKLGRKRGKSEILAESGMGEEEEMYKGFTTLNAPHYICSLTSCLHVDAPI